MNEKIKDNCDPTRRNQAEVANGTWLEMRRFTENVIFYSNFYFYIFRNYDYSSTFSENLKPK